MSRSHFNSCLSPGGFPEIKVSFMVIKSLCVCLHVGQWGRSAEEDQPEVAGLDWRKRHRQVGTGSACGSISSAVRAAIVALLLKSLSVISLNRPFGRCINTASYLGILLFHEIKSVLASQLLSDLSFPTWPLFSDDSQLCR